MKLDFRPPRDNRLLIRTIYLALPLIMRLRHVSSVQLGDSDWEHLASIRDTRLILSANHPTGTDPLVAMNLARRLGRYFNFVAARENFVGPYGWLLQRLGVYSIIRGAPDRESMQTTRRLLSTLDRKVALFPEGETYYHNDIVLPFHSGVTQLGFWALTDLLKLGKEPYLPILPVAIKYRFLDNPEAEIEERLQRLEEAVGLKRGAGFNWYPRLVAVGEKIVWGMEREYRLPQDKPAELTERISRIKDHILNRVEAAVGESRPDAPLPDRMRALFNALRQYSNEFLEADGNTSGGSEYARRLHARRTEEARPLFADLWRLHDCMAITGHYVRDHPSCERFSDVLSRLEEEVLGHARAWTRRQALVRIAEPLELSTWLSEYQSDRRKVVENATRILEERVTSLLRELWDTGHPLPAARTGII